MLRNYLKIAWRNLLRNKAYSAINIGGLAVGMAACLLISIWLRDELSYNRFLPNAKDIYYVRINFPFNNQVFTATVTPGPLQETIAKDVPQVAAVTKFDWGPEYLIKVGDKAAKEKGHYATSDFFSVFDLPALYGNPKTALANPNQIVITRSLAEKFFPGGLALGKLLQLNNDKYYTVGAVIENLPKTSTLQFDWLINWKVQEQPWMNAWGNNNYWTYVRLKPHTTPAQAEAAMSGFYARYANKGAGDGRPVLQPITDVHLYSNYQNGRPVGGRIEYVRLFSLVALALLLIACINFMNLTTARSAVRAKEIGIRKVVGALRSWLVGQFLSESLLMTLLASGLALSMVGVALPTFNALFDKHLMLDLSNPMLWLIIVALMLVTALLSGSYPALFLSGLQPVRILKGTLRAGIGPANSRQVLVVFQFSLSIFLIIGMLVVGRQMDYLQTKQLGLNRENVVYVPLEGEIEQPKKVESFRQQVLRQPTVISATTTDALPVNIQSSSGDLEWAGKRPGMETSVSVMQVGSDFIKTTNINILNGRDFRANNLADSSNYLINEAAAKLMGMNNPVGNEVKFWNGKGHIVGLMQDFHLSSLHNIITPLVVMFNPKQNGYLLVKIRAGQTERAINDLERLTKRFNPNYPFAYHFLDEAYEKLYLAEQQVHTLVNYFGVLAILLSCLGLFGLSAFTAEARTKEIGVRKVLGASVSSIVALLSKDFLKLVLIAIVIASPIAWWAMNRWLQDFAYRIDIEWWVFALAGLLAVGIALLTVSFQSVKAALMNPVKSLRSE